MTDIYWQEQNESDVPGANNWLGTSELLRLSSLRFPKRRSDWRLGRWTAKRAVAICLNIPDDRQTLARIEIRAAPSGAPEVFLDNEPANSTISLSHSSGRAICAVGPASVALGCDLEQVESRSHAFLSDYFTAEEQALICRAPAADRPRLLALLWSAKESALKALHAGLRLDTRSVSVRLDGIGFADPDWNPLEVHTRNQVFHGWWRHSENFIETVVADPAPSVPVLNCKRLAGCGKSPNPSVF
jgi:4'-phosphopantetheinyl transferase